MKITDLLSVGAVDLNVTASSKEEVLKKAVELMVRQGNITDKEQYLKAVFAREEEGTTGVGDGIAIPHGRCEGVSQPGLIAMVIPKGVDYDALDAPAPGTSARPVISTGVEGPAVLTVRPLSSVMTRTRPTAVPAIRTSP